MCLLSISIKSKITNKKWLENAFHNNSDGAGFAWVNDKSEIVCEKGFFDFDSFYSAYCNIPENKTILLHFRATSRGLTNEDNCHPFFVNKNLVYAHNGTIQGFYETNKSDTYLFNEKILKPLIGRFVNLKKEFLYLLQEAIGINNKLVFLNNKEEFYIINQKEGHWVDEKIWFSNHSYNYKTNFLGTRSNSAFVGDYYQEVQSLSEWIRKIMIAEPV